MELDDLFEELRRHKESEKAALVGYGQELAGLEAELQGKDVEVRELQSVREGALIKFMKEHAMEEECRRKLERCRAETSEKWAHLQRLQEQCAAVAEATREHRLAGTKVSETLAKLTQRVAAIDAQLEVDASLLGGEVDAVVGTLRILDAEVAAKVATEVAVTEQEHAEEAPETDAIDALEEKRVTMGQISRTSYMSGQRYPTPPPMQLPIAYPAKWSENKVQPRWQPEPEVQAEWSGAHPTTAPPTAARGLEGIVLDLLRTLQQADELTIASHVTSLGHPESLSIGWTLRKLVDEFIVYQDTDGNFRAL